MAEFVVRDIPRKDDRGVVAGGSYRNDVESVRPTARGDYDPGWQAIDDSEPKSKSWMWGAPHVGFRVVMEDDSGKAK